MNQLARLQPATTRPPAETYDEVFVPTLFGRFTGIVTDLAALRPGMKVLDVGCGTGALSLAALENVRPGGAVTTPGSDLCDPDDVWELVDQIKAVT
jgi:ribosomal protein L11 methylase PrmA